MKTRLILIITLVFLARNIQAQESKASVQLAAAIYEEEVTGNLDKAVQIYQDILKNFPNDRPVAAKALYHLGLVNEKMGKQKANEYFNRLINTYPDQTEMVSLAKERLASLGHPGDKKEFITRRILADASDIGGALSADGRNINRMDRRNGDVIQFDVASMKVNRIINKGPWDEYELPVETIKFSYDGKQIVYDRFTKEMEPELRIRNLDGSGLRTLYHEKGSYIFPLAWTPDAEYVLAVRGEYSQMKEIILISTASGMVKVLKNIAAGPYMLNRACFSPDGRYIAYSLIRSGTPPHGDLFLMTTDGRNEVNIAGHPAEDELLAWRPDGKGLLFLSDRSGTWDIWTVIIAEGKQQGEAGQVKKDFGKDAEFLGITSSGSLYYRFNTPSGGLFSSKVDIETGKIISLPSQVPTRYTGTPFNLSWSPDGMYLLYLSHRGSINTGYNLITIRSASTGEERFLSPNLRFVYDINWAPDGRSIVAYGITETEIGNFRIDIETNKTSRLKVTGRVPRLCMDGKTILYVRAEEGGIWLKKHNMDNGKEEVIAPMGAVSYDLSPDGTKVVCFKDSTINIYPIGIGEPEILIRGLAKYYSLRWTNDGRNIIARNVDNNDIWRIPVQGGTAVKLDLSVPNMMFFALHPDNRSFMFSTRDGYKSELWVMENFLPK